MNLRAQEYEIVKASEPNSGTFLYTPAREKNQNYLHLPSLMADKIGSKMNATSKGETTSGNDSAGLRCPRCGGQDRQIREQTFKDGTKHDREECCNCGHFFRYAPKSRPGRQPLPITSPATPAAPSATPLPASNTTLARTLDVLDCVHDRSAELREELRSKPPDQAEVTALFGAALAASANLSAENITSLTNAVRQGRLPRRKGSVTP